MTAHGRARWFEMVGEVLLDAATQANLPPDLNIRLVERYIDGTELSPGLVQGLRFDIVNGKPAFQLGARPDERGDITVEVTKAASYTLNTLRSEDPRFHAAFTNLLAAGELKIDGDLSQLGSWFSVVHDRIVDHTS
ncbi:hypothetical protein GTP56_22845 [Duganella sp. FT134W]|uniref:Alkyl sulfatase C-terminal domain-containing protein n=1 Tax=Duganella margarita TaxID=2692170 RepID=A0A7X4H461_9BURK|nr:hypothetical protein [Duganella margarita]MYM75012.1 hypothetical protein [Duganella margarita]